MSIRELYDSVVIGCDISLCVDAPKEFGGTHEIFYGDIATLLYQEFIYDDYAAYGTSGANINKIDVVDEVLTLYIDF